MESCVCDLPPAAPETARADEHRQNAGLTRRRREGGEADDQDYPHELRRRSGENSAGRTERSGRGRCASLHHSVVQGRGFLAEAQQAPGQPVQLEGEYRVGKDKPIMIEVEC